MIRKREAGPSHGEFGIPSLLRGLGGVVDLLSKLADQAEKAGGEFKRSGELGDDNKGLKAVYGFSVRLGAGKPLVETFGNVKDQGSGPVVEEAREPMVDIFDEEDHLLLIAELPGVDQPDIVFDLKDDVLTLSAARGDRKYRKEVLIPAMVRMEKASASYRNGVFELRLPKAPAAGTRAGAQRGAP